jgi:hypothetical protein
VCEARARKQKLGACCDLYGSLHRCAPSRHPLGRRGTGRMGVRTGAVRVALQRVVGPRSALSIEQLSLCGNRMTTRRKKRGVGGSVRGAGGRGSLNCLNIYLESKLCFLHAEVKRRCTAAQPQTQQDTTESTDTCPLRSRLRGLHYADTVSQVRCCTLHAGGFGVVVVSYHNKNHFCSTLCPAATQ